ncbi:ankyrin repeat-containing domain protein [Phyllosticta capitalensis]
MEAPQSSLWTETTQATPWLELNDKYHAGLCKSCPKLLKTATFGWQNVPSNCKESDVVLLQTTDSREKACAQEIYSMFLMSIIGVVKNIGGTTTSPKDHKHFHLANTNVSRIQEAFTKNNLGSVEEALACLIPVLRIQNKFPPLDGLDSDGQTLLHQAINRGESVSTISSLLEIGADVDVPNANGESPLFALANHRESKIATETTRNIGALLLLAHGDNPQRLNIQGESPLHRAAVKGNIVMAELLSKDADEYVLNQRKGETEGIYSIYSCNIPKGNAMRVHRNSRFTGESETRLGKPRMLETPLFLAIFHGHYEVAEILLENGADPRIPRLDGETALAKASESDNVQIIKLLIERGADVNSKALGSPLHRTAEFGRKDIAELLIKANAEMNARRENGATRTSRKFSETPLFLAVWFEKIDLVRLFLESGADPNIPREDGEKPLWTAVWRNREDMVQLLLEHGADVDSRGGWWETALSFAKREQRTNLVEILLKHGADSKLCMDEPPVWTAACNKQLNVLEKLLRSGADPNVVGNRDGDTPIFQTVWGTTREPLTKLLLESGANPNHVNKFGMTTLHNIIRCWGGNTTWASGDMTGTVNLLLDWGLDPTIKNKNGETARNMAMKGNMTWAIGMLEHAERVWGEREEKEVAPGSQERGRKTEGQ